MIGSNLSGDANPFRVGGLGYQQYAMSTGHNQPLNSALSPDLIFDRANPTIRSKCLRNRNLRVVPRQSLDRRALSFSNRRSRGIDVVYITKILPGRRHFATPCNSEVIIPAALATVASAWASTVSPTTQVSIPFSTCGSSCCRSGYRRWHQLLQPYSSRLAELALGRLHRQRRGTCKPAPERRNAPQSHLYSGASAGTDGFDRVGQRWVLKWDWHGTRSFDLGLIVFRSGR